MESLFSTHIHRAGYGAGGKQLSDDICAAALSFAQDDDAGIAWCAKNAYPGYTSYGSLDDLPTRAPCFAELKKHLDKMARAFAESLYLDLGGGRLKLDNMWVNVLQPGGFHSGHVHPHCVISGTYYARVPDGASALKFEDPRLPMMMAAPPRRADAPEGFRQFVYVAPKEGEALMWESWLRHEVVRSTAKEPRISVSFNYKWA